MSNVTFNADLATARAALGTLKRDKGVRPAAARAFLEAETHEAREEVVEFWAAGLVRRGLREAAVFFEGHGNQDAADAFWALRDDIDIDGEVFTTVDTDALLNVAA